MDGRKYGGGCMYGCMDGWEMDELMNGWVDGCMAGYMHGCWVDE